MSWNIWSGIEWVKLRAAFSRWTRRASYYFRNRIILCTLIVPIKKVFLDCVQRGRIHFRKSWSDLRFENKFSWFGGWWCWGGEKFSKLWSIKDICVSWITNHGDLWTGIWRLTEISISCFTSRTENKMFFVSAKHEIYPSDDNRTFRWSTRAKKLIFCKIFKELQDFVWSNTTTNTISFLAQHLKNTFLSSSMVKIINQEESTANWYVYANDLFMRWCWQTIKVAKYSWHSRLEAKQH